MASAGRVCFVSADTASLFAIGQSCGVRCVQGSSPSLPNTSPTSPIRQCSGLDCQERPPPPWQSIPSMTNGRMRAEASQEASSTDKKNGVAEPAIPSANASTARPPKKYGKGIKQVFHYYFDRHDPRQSAASPSIPMFHCVWHSGFARCFVRCFVDGLSACNPGGLPNGPGNSKPLAQVNR